MVQKIWRLFQIFIRQFFRGVVNDQVRAQRHYEYGSETANPFGVDAEKAAVQRLMQCAKHAVTLKHYMAGYECWSDGKPKTFCNVFARKFMTGSLGRDLYDNVVLPGFEWLNHDLSAVAPDGLHVLYYNTPIPRMMRACLDAANAGLIDEVSEDAAQRLANVGRVVFGICDWPGWNHEFLVYPGDVNQEIRIFQQGLYPLCGQPISHPYCFGKDWRIKLEGHVRFFLFPLKREV